MTIAFKAPPGSTPSPTPGNHYLPQTEATHLCAYRNHGSVIIALRRQRPSGAAFWQTFTEIGREDAVKLVAQLLEYVAENDIEAERETHGR